MYKKSIYIIALFLFLSASTHAQKKWSLKECIDYAIENNIAIKQSALGVKGAELDLKSSRDSRYPNLNSSIGQNLNFGRTASMSTGVYESNPTTTYSSSFGLNTNMNVFSGLRVKHDIEAKKFSLLESEEDLNRIKDNMELQLVAYYLDILLKKEVLIVYQEQAKLNKEQVERTKVMVETGSVSESQLFDIEAQYAQDLSNIVSAESSLQLALLSLAQTLNLTNSEQFDIIEPNAIIDVNTNTVDATSVYEESLMIKPHIKVAEYNLKARESTLKTAKSSYWPTVSLGASYNSGFAYLLKNDHSDPLYEQWKESARQNISLNISIPIFNRFQVKNQVKSAQYSIENSKLQLEQVKLNLYKDIQQAHQRVGTSKAKYQASIITLDATEKAFNFAKERYDVGRSTVFEYNEAQTKFTRSKSEQIQAKFDFLFQNKILDFYRGNSLDF